jgi:hypothetical protein
MTTGIHSVDDTDRLLSLPVIDADVLVPAFWTGGGPAD